MTVVSCQLRDVNASLVEDKSFRRTYVQEYIVTTDDPGDGPKTVLEGAEGSSPDALPILWSTYPQFTGTGTGGADTNVFLQNREVRRLDDGTRTKWVVTCTWASPEPGDSGSEPPDENPLLRPVQYSLEWSAFTKVISKDIDGEPLLNSAGDLFENVEIDSADPVLVCVKNMFPLEDIIALAIAYRNAVNEEEFFGAPPRTCKMEAISSGPLMEENGYQYYQVTFRIQFKEETWDLFIVNRGTQAYFYKNEHHEDLGYMTKMRVRVGGSGGYVNRPITGTGTATHTAGFPSDDDELLDIANLNYGGSQRAEDADPAGLFLPEDPTGSGAEGFQVYPIMPFADLELGGTA